MGVLGLAPRAIGYNLQRALGKPVMRPFNLTISVTGRCNSRCKTCDIWKYQPENELNLNEWQSILSDIGKSPEWITVSGGEPFLRKDLADILKTIIRVNRASYITVATNGMLTDTILEVIKKVKQRLIVNVSIDGSKDLHDNIRGVICYEKAIETIRALKKQNVIVGVHTVISKYNVNELKDLCESIEILEPDSHICQIAEHRKELKNNPDIIPTEKEYQKALQIFNGKGKGIGKILRQKYYRQSSGGKKPRCFAGIASAHVNYNGDLWACCVKCETLGNLKEKNFRELWKSQKAKDIRKRIKEENCACNLANASYSNTICDPISMFR